MHHLLAEFYSTYWALDRITLDAMTLVVDRWATGMRLSAEEIRAAIGDAPQRRADRAAAAQGMSGGGVAVVPMYGVLTHRGYAADNVSGGGLTSTERLATTLSALVRDTGVSAIVVDCDSPGGSVNGCQELADAIYGMRGEKPIVGVANATMASGALWTLSQCDEIVVTPSGAVGSIGIITSHDNLSAAMEKAGVQRDYIYAGQNKAEGNPTGPLTDETRAYMQSLADSHYGAFTKSVARGRNVPLDTVRSDAWGQGRVLLAQEAVKAGMADRVGTLEDTVARLARPQARRAAMSASVAQAQLAHLRLNA